MIVNEVSVDRRQHSNLGQYSRATDGTGPRFGVGPVPTHPWTQPSLRSRSNGAGETRCSTGLSISFIRRLSPIVSRFEFHATWKEGNSPVAHPQSTPWWSAWGLGVNA